MDDKNGEMTDRDTANEGARALLRLLGQDPSREGLEDTPRRVLQAYLDLRRDWREPSEPLGHVFKADAAGSKLTSVNGIPCSSLCEHHLMPFTGVAHVAYLPTKDAVVGLSKIPRLVQHIAVRPQMQERMTQSICEMIVGGLLPKVTHAYSKAFTRA